MSLPLPSSLSPSKVSAFKDCALAFRFSAIDRLPEPTSPWAAKGTLVHKALELLFTEHRPGARDRAAAAACLDRAWELLGDDPEFTDLELSPDDAASFRSDAAALVDRYFRLEDPNAIQAEGTELMLEAKLGTLTVRGIIDRLERDSDGGLVVTDYKTGKVPPPTAEQSRLGGVHFYAWLCQEVLGERPARVQLLYLAEPVVISTEPTEQSVRGMKVRAQAVWTAVERACQTEDFRPRPSGLCDWCAFRAYCPAFGGDPRAARADVQPRLELDVAPAPARVAG